MSTQQQILFQKPVYMKYNKGDGSSNPIPAYIFNATMVIESIAVFAESGKTEITALMDALISNKESYMNILCGFVSVANQSFNKSYSATALAKHIKHSGISNSIISVPTTIEYTPKLIMLAESTFTLVWNVQKEERIDVPDLETVTNTLSDVSLANEEKTVINTIIANEQIVDKQGISHSHTTYSESSGLDELDADSLPAAEPIDFSPVSSGAGNKSNHTYSRHDDKRKLHGAQLRLKLAQYKAEKAIAKYIEKYGEENLTDFDSDESDFSSEEESEE